MARPLQIRRTRFTMAPTTNGSGTVSVIEIAPRHGGLEPRPKRSIVFMTFFGEERGELGSQYYGKHPVFPISQDCRRSESGTGWPN